MIALAPPMAAVDDIVGAVFLTTCALVLLGSVALCIRRGWPVAFSIPISFTLMGIVALGMGLDNLKRVGGQIFGRSFLLLLGALIVVFVVLAARDLIRSTRRRSRNPWHSRRKPPEEL